MKNVIWWDMDGTIADLYGIPDWLPKLRSYDPSPYVEAEVMHNMSLLARYMNKVQSLGYQIGIISWLSKDSPETYSEAVTAAKLTWLEKHLPSVHFDYIYITEYGYPKENFMVTNEDILFDDNFDIRDAWRGAGYGEAFEPDQIIKVLKEIVWGEN